jgi:hypothetical protein
MQGDTLADATIHQRCKSSTKGLKIGSGADVEIIGKEPAGIRDDIRSGTNLISPGITIDISGKRVSAPRFLRYEQLLYPDSEIRELA